MKPLTQWYVWGAMMCIAFRGFGQVGEKVGPVHVLKINNQSVALPMLGQKNLLIFYADPSRPQQNKDFRNYMKLHPVYGPNVDSYGVVNMAAAPLIPAALIRKMAKKEVKGTDGQVYFDPDEALSKAWRLPGANRNFTVIFVNKDHVIEFYKAGQLTSGEQEQVLQLLRKYEK